MVKKNNLIMVDSTVLPDVFLKVLTAKKLLRQGEVSTVHEAAHRAGISRSAFYKKFKSLSKHSINDLIKVKRLNKAATLLNESYMNISEICYECGFADPSYFTKVFKEHYHITPKDYQLQMYTQKRS